MDDELGGARMGPHESGGEFGVTRERQRGSPMGMEEQTTQVAPAAFSERSPRRRAGGPLL